MIMLLVLDLVLDANLFSEIINKLYICMEC